MPKHKKSDFAPHRPKDTAPACNIAGCKEPGAYKAPKSRDALHEYQWFCLDHIREHNKQWDFFAGLSSDQIEEFIKDSVTGHRPTWTRESRVSSREQLLKDALYEFLHPGQKPRKATPHLPARIKKALATFDMEYPYTAAQLKTQYRALVKKHHPDVNKGNKQSEELFKRISLAYTLLQEHLKHQK